MRAAGDPVQAAFPPEFAGFGRTLLPPQPEAVPLPDLLEPSQLDGRLATYAAAFPGADRRAVLSLWSQYYLLALLPPAIARVLVTAGGVPGEVAAAGVILSPASCPIAVCVPDGACPAAPDCPAERLTPLLRGHLAGLAASLAGAGLPAPVLWSNAAVVLNWTLRTVIAPEALVRRVAGCAACAHWVDGGPNPLAAECGSVSCGSHRRTCCLRRRVPGMATCPDCPLARARA